MDGGDAVASVGRKLYDDQKAEMVNVAYVIFTQGQLWSANDRVRR
jgi:hypothetical protein